ncbi:formate dehydrogenase accessory protein FdhE [Corticibacter populi]|uniref:Protein FdhE homolog n=1 Tax=Corticibacter populi TaxID=1550736 RepID=A0A3M6QKM4_9BURK|nr:formate dehydrogenase accessory protein FdhE [Corticibacter populi]RMX03049.1 formate dehydrogenase accessory protein FdhE [Corticibacter populi]RZS33487.1 Tat proofreading chaperone FdhE [Corticibacter populi]
MSEVPLRTAIPLEEATRHFDPILRPELAALYTRRAARLRELAKGHELADYLRLAADVADGQAAQAAEPVPVPSAASDTAPAAVTTAVDLPAIARGGDWPALLDRLIARVRPQAPAAAAAHLDALAAMPEAERRQAAVRLAEGAFAEVDQAIAPFLWAALSLAVAQAARQVALPAPAEQESAHCPVCGTAPVASLIHTGERQGLRYLHCAMCECEWHMVRAKCSNCGDAGQLDYLSFDSPEASIRAEACGACGGYLKVISCERDQHAEVVADDLASLVLDDAAQTEGFGRSGFNPFALPG